MSLLDLYKHPVLKAWRDELRAQGRCINGSRDPSRSRGRYGIEHGPVVRGGKCQRCLDVHKRSA